MTREEKIICPHCKNLYSVKFTAEQTPKFCPFCGKQDNLEYITRQYQLIPY